jgi:YfiH family protein
VRAVRAEDAGRGGASRASLLPPADALITAERDLYLFACFADCVPLLFVDPVRYAVGIAHAGWRGTLAGIATATVRAFGQHFGSRPADLRVVVGPSAGPCCYEVGEEVVAAIEQTLPNVPGILLRPPGADVHFDLWRANTASLRGSGVLPEHIHVSGMCTIHNHQRFFSHRASGGQTGRFAAIIGLRPERIAGERIREG